MLGITGISSQGGGNTLGGVAFDFAAEAFTTVDVPVAASQTDKPIALAFTRANLAAIIILVTVDMTLETNSSSAPDDSFALKAGKPFVYVADAGTPVPFSADVTTGFLTNTTAGSFQALIFLKDITA